MKQDDCPDFTIVTPSYNYGRFIGDCLESVARQEGVSVEHLVIDACSTDETGEVVAGFSHVEFVREPDSGMTDGINKGFRRARGTWVMWLNADDRLQPGALRAVKEFAEGHPGSDVIYGGWNFVSGNGEKIREMTVMPFQRMTLIYLGCYLGSTATFLRRSRTIAEDYYLDDSFKYVMDGEYYCRLARDGKKFTYFHSILADFRIHENNLSLSNRSCAGDLSQLLKAEYQLSESRAIKRFYGWNLTGNVMVDSVIYTFFYYLFLVRKGITKRTYRLLHPVKKLQGVNSKMLV